MPPRKGRNHGSQPGETRGKRVIVSLFNGMVNEPNGWPADGKGACNWAISDPPHPFEIKFWRVIE